jgi:hypothetical protein
MNISKASGYFMYHQISIKIFYDTPIQRMYENVFRVELRTELISLHSTN